MFGGVFPSLPVDPHLRLTIELNTSYKLVSKSQVLTYYNKLNVEL